MLVAHFDILVSKVRMAKATFVFYRPFCFKLPLCLILVVLSNGLAQSTDEPVAETSEKVLTKHFAINVVPDGLLSKLRHLEQHADAAFDSVSDSLGVTISDRIEVFIEPPQEEPCPLRALSEPVAGKITFYVDGETSSETLMGLLAHEVGHVLHIRGLRVDTGDRGLFEGLATWAGRNYWAIMQGSPSLDASVRSYHFEESFLKLYEYPDLKGAYNAAAGLACLERRDILYTEWGSFVGYLINIYGLDRFIALMATSSFVAPGEKPDTPNYMETYNRSFRDLHSDWVDHILTNRSGFQFQDTTLNHQARNGRKSQ